MISGDKINVNLAQQTFTFATETNGSSVLQSFEKSDLVPQTPRFISAFGTSQGGKKSQDSRAPTALSHFFH